MIRAPIYTLGLGLIAAALTLNCGSSPAKKKLDGAVGGEGGDGGGGGSGGGGSGGSGGSAGRGGSGGGGVGGSGGGGSGGGGSGGGGAGGAMDAAPADAANDTAPPDLPPDAPPVVFSPPKAPWLGRDIGMVGTQVGGAALSTTMNGGQNWDIIGGGTTGIGGTADSLFFMYQPMAGPAVLQGRLVSLTMADVASTGGFMIRETLDADSPMVFVGAVGDNTGGKVVIRRAKGQAAVTAPADGTTIMGLRAANGTVVRLARVGGAIRITAGGINAVETDGALVGGGMAEINVTNPNATLYYGIAVTAAQATMPAQARFNELAVNNLASNNLTDTWAHYAIGTTGTSAVWTTGPNRLTLSALGQPWGAVMGTSRDFLGYTFFRTTEAQSLRFLVASNTMSDPASRVAAMIRDVNNFDRSNATIALSLTQGGGLELQQRTGNGAGNELVKVATKDTVKAPLWLRLDRSLVPRPGDPLGATDTYVTAYYAADNNGNPGAWNVVGNSLPFASTLANPPGLGIGIGSYAPTTYHQAEITRIQVVAAPPPPDGGIPADAGPDAGPDATPDAAADAATTD
jgi:hypothetical protein